jgi:hypothetical protein
MSRARMLISPICAIALAFGGGVLWWNVAHDARPTGGCVAHVVPTTGTAAAGPDDILLTEQPWEGSVSARVGQRLVVVLTGTGTGGWVAPHIDGSAVSLSGSIGAYDYRCPGTAPFAELAVLRADSPGVATLSSVTDAACLHPRPGELGCTIPQRTWKRTVNVTEG